MPKTANYLKDLNAIDFTAYHPVGTNTFANLIPLLTGKTEQELQATCWKKPYHRFDPCDFIWKFYKKRNYATAFVEDISSKGIFTTYSKTGFKKKPTDHYWTSFNAKVVEITGSSYASNIPLCLGGKPTHQHFLDYLQKIATTYTESETKFFSFFWSYSLTHNFLNLASTGDLNFENMFKLFNKSGVFKKTFLFFLSDQGYRSEIPFNKLYKMEGSPPFLYIVVPELFKELHDGVVQNLKTNSKRLVTSVDIYQTLISIASDRFKLVRSSKAYTQDLFQVIPSTRTCKSVGIPEKICLCL